MKTHERHAIKHATQIARRAVYVTHKHNDAEVCAQKLLMCRLNPFELVGLGDGNISDICRVRKFRTPPSDVHSKYTVRRTYKIMFTPDKSQMACKHIARTLTMLMSYVIFVCGAPLKLDLNYILPWARTRLSQKRVQHGWHILTGVHANITPRTQTSTQICTQQRCGAYPLFSSLGKDECTRRAHALYVGCFVVNTLICFLFIYIYSTWKTP